MRTVFLGLSLLTLILLCACGVMWTSLGSSSGSSLIQLLSYAPPTVVQAASSTGNNATAAWPLAFTSNNTAGNLIVAICQSASPGTILSVTDSNGNSYQTAVTNTRGAYGEDGLFYAANINGGANTVTCHSSVGGNFLTTHVLEYTGVASTNPLDVAQGTNGNSAAQSVSLTTTQSNDLLVNFMDVVTGPIGFDLSCLMRDSTLTTHATYGNIQDRVVKTPGLYSLTNTSAASNWISIAAAFKGAPGYTLSQSLYVLGGADGNSTVRPTVLKSINQGLSWTSVGVMPGNRQGMCAYNYANKMWVVGGDDGAAAHNNVWSSSDGQTWTTVGTLPTNLSYGACALYNNQMWIIGGTTDNTDAGSVTTVLSSSDGVTWATLGNIPVATNGPQATVYNSKVWFSSGYNSAGTQLTNTYWSVNGSVWNASAAIPSQRENAVFVVQAGQMLWIGGDSFGTPQLNVYECTDPCAGWNYINNVPVRQTHAQGTMMGGVYYQYGSGDNDPEVQSTPDEGTTWTDIATTPELRSYGQMMAWP